MHTLESTGQDALEYLLLITASIVIVAIVISFVSGVLPLLMGEGDKDTFDFICSENNDNNNDFVCGCYLCDETKAGVNEATGNFEIPTVEGCRLLADKLNQPLLNNCKNRLSD